MSGHVVVDPRPYVAEFLGDFFFVLAGIGASLNASTLGPVGVAFAHGLALFAMIACTAPISGGHLNPAVTLALLFRGEIGARRAAGYVICQLAGGTLAAFVAVMVDPWSSSLGTPALGADVDILRGWILEVFFTSMLVFVAIRTAVDQKSTFAPLVIGFTVAGLALAFGSVTGASMNPARWFGPAILSGSLESHWVYWSAPVVGAFIGVGFNKAVSKKAK